ncbi:hypothetical protein [Terrihabitans sp. B22-R8]|uniref:hypothetical protein n=1 Tax=Terrihabitans sp. B22-R8 TaxID=3425128 RepID=UPI00403C9E3F
MTSNIPAGATSLPVPDFSGIRLGALLGLYKAMGAAQWVFVGAINMPRIECDRHAEGIANQLSEYMDDLMGAIAGVVRNAAPDDDEAGECLALLMDFEARRGEHLAGCMGGAEECARKWALEPNL